MTPSQQHMLRHGICVWRLPSHPASFLCVSLSRITLFLSHCITHQVCLLNYRKDGSTFINQFFLSPIKVGVVWVWCGRRTHAHTAQTVHTAESVVWWQTCSTLHVGRRNVWPACSTAVCLHAVPHAHLSRLLTYVLSCCRLRCRSCCVVLCVLLQDDQGIVTHYVGIQTDVSAAAEAGLLAQPDQLTEQQAAGGCCVVVVASACGGTCQVRSSKHVVVLAKFAGSKHGCARILNSSMRRRQIVVECVRDRRE